MEGVRRLGRRRRWVGERSLLTACTRGRRGGRGGRHRRLGCGVVSLCMVGRVDCVVTVVGVSVKWFDASTVLFLLVLGGRRGRALHLRREEALRRGV